MLEFKENVRSTLRLYRESRGLTIKELAEGLDIPAASLSNMESGDQTIDNEFLLKVANYFEVTVNILLNGSETEHLSGELDIRGALKYILDHYQEAKMAKFKKHKLGNHVRKLVKDIITKNAELEHGRYYITGSVGQGRWAEIPWISIFIRDITTTATKGYYIVYLFKADMSGVYISLNQGWTYFETKYAGAKLGYEKIQLSAKMVRKKLNFIPDHLSSIEISLEGRGDLAKGYEGGHIYGRFYSADNLPSSEELISDLKELLTTYKEIEYLIGERTFAQFNDYLLLGDDGQFLEEQQQEEDFQIKVQSMLDKKTKVAEKNSKDEIETEDAPLQKPKPVFDHSKKARWPRDAKVAARALHLSKFKCAFDESHVSFTSKVTGEQYLEVHHLVPMKYQGKFEVSLDRESQLLALCPTCHRQIHHGTDEDKKNMLSKLLEDRRERLKIVGIEIDLDELCKMYGIEVQV